MVWIGHACECEQRPSHAGNLKPSNDGETHVGYVAPSHAQTPRSAIEKPPAGSPQQAALTNRMSVATKAVAAYASGSIFSIPPMYGRRTSGTVMEPSAFW